MWLRCALLLLSIVRESELGQRLNAEFHARPPLSLGGATQIRHLAFLSVAGGAADERLHLKRLTDGGGWATVEASDAYCVLARGDARLRWELHTEFSSYTLIEPADVRAADVIDAEAMATWLAGISGEALAQLRIEHRLTPAITAEQLIADMTAVEHQVVVSHCVDGRAAVITDFKFIDGEMNVLLLNGGMTQRQAGRTVQRLWEIETYRLLALLGLPVAKQMSPWLRQAEEQLATLMDSIGSAQTPDEEHAVLDRLSSLASSVEHSVARTAFRFGASRAYAAIVMQRIGELREQRVTGFPTLQEFMERRLQPPMNTCAAMAQRQEDLSARVARNSQLLRTRVDIALERQNQKLLAQMNQRARQQLHLQETVEGLSVVAITYYGSQLVHYLADGAHVVGLHVEPALMTALSIPLIALSVWLGLRRMRKALSAQATGK